MEPCETLLVNQNMWAMRNESREYSDLEAGKQSESEKSPNQK